MGVLCFWVPNCSVNDKKMKAIFSIAVILPMAIIVGTRNPSVGTDTSMYYEIFQWVRNSDFSFSLYDDVYHVEIGYRGLNYLIGLFTSDPSIFMFVISSITIALYGVLFYKYSNNIWLTLFLFVSLSFYVETFNTVRQQLTCGIVFLATKYLLSGNRIKWTISVLVAMCFHITAAFLLIFNFLIPITKKRVFLFSISSLIGLFSIAAILTFIASMYPDFKYLYYFAQLNTGSGSLGDYLRAGLFSVVIVYILIKKKTLIGSKIDSYEKKCIVVWGVFLLYAIVFILAKQQYVIFYRMIQYCAPFLCLLLPMILMKINSLVRYQIYSIMLVILPMVLYYLLKINIDALAYSSFLFSN